MLRCSSCNGLLVITGFEGSAVHTSCPTCNSIARPKSLKPVPVQMESAGLSAKRRAINKIRSVPIEVRRPRPRLVPAFEPA